MLIETSFVFFQKDAQKVLKNVCGDVFEKFFVQFFAKLRKVKQSTKKAELTTILAPMRQCRNLEEKITWKAMLKNEVYGQISKLMAKI